MAFLVESLASTLARFAEAFDDALSWQLAGPGAQLVVDAGANAVLEVAANGDVSTVAVFGRRSNPTPIGPPF